MTLPVSPRPLRVLVADDQELVRAGFRLILEAAGFTVVGEAADGAEALTLAARERPDVVLMDIRMPVMDGLAATRQLTAPAAHGDLERGDPGRGGLERGDPEHGDPGHGAPKVVILTTFDLDDYVYEALRSGASGFLLKDAPRADLIAAVRVAAAGDALLAPSVTRRLIEAFAMRPASASPAPSALASLTPREQDILLLVARGQSNTEIARALVVSEATVKTHVTHLLAKLGLRDRVQAVILAYETGAVTPGRPD
jgi:DNA-binding NarL/FixJ family response regulator